MPLICSCYLFMKYTSLKIWVCPLNKSIKIGKPKRMAFLVIILANFVFYIEGFVYQSYPQANYLFLSNNRGNNSMMKCESLIPVRIPVFGPGSPNPAPISQSPVPTPPTQFPPPILDDSIKISQNTKELVKVSEKTVGRKMKYLPPTQINPWME